MTWPYPMCAQCSAGKNTGGARWVTPVPVVGPTAEIGCGCSPITSTGVIGASTMATPTRLTTSPPGHTVGRTTGPTTAASTGSRPGATRAETLTRCDGQRVGRATRTARRSRWVRRTDHVCGDLVHNMCGSSTYYARISIHGSCIGYTEYVDRKGQTLRSTEGSHATESVTQRHIEPYRDGRSYTGVRSVTMALTCENRDRF